jgi:hypothetical protein
VGFAERQFAIRVRFRGFAPRNNAAHIRNRSWIVRHNQALQALIVFAFLFAFALFGTEMSVGESN